VLFLLAARGYCPLIDCIAPTLLSDLHEHIETAEEREFGFADTCFHPQRMILLADIHNDEFCAAALHELANFASNN